MSQFVIGIGVPQEVGVPSVKIRMIESNEGGVLGEVARQVQRVHKTERCWTIVDAAWGDSEPLFEEAQEELANGGVLVETRLGQALEHLLDGLEVLVFWYGNEWSGLPIVTRKEGLFEAMAQQMMSSAGELYLEYRKAPG